MSSLVGMRFRPSDEEIINYFLKKKRDDPNYSVDTINQVDIYKFEPSALPNLSLIQSKEPEWFFFCALGYKNKRAKRSTESGSGYWKITGKHRNAKTKRTKQVIGTKKTLVFYHRNPGSKDTKTNWVMHEYHSNHPQDAFVICRIKRKPDRRPNTATPVTVFHQPHHDIISDSANHEAENAFPEEDNSPLPNHYVVSNSRNHVAQTTFLEAESEDAVWNQYMVSDLGNHVVQSTNQLLSNHYMVSNLQNHVEQDTNPPPSNHYMVSDIGNDVAQNTNQDQYLVSDLGSFVAQNIFPQAENEEALLNQYMVSDIGNHVAQNTNPLQSNHYMVSDIENHVAQNTNQSLSNHHMVSDIGIDVAQNTYLGSPVAQNTFLQVEPLLLVKLNALDDCNGLGHNSFSKQQLPIQSEQESTYSVLSSQLNSEHEDDFWNLLRDVQGEYSCEETVYTLPSDESSRGVHGGDNNDTDTETVNGGVDEYPSIAEFYFNSPCNPQLDFIGECKYC